MPQSAKERMRKYRERIKNDPSRYSSYIENERTRWKKRRESGKVKSVKDLDEREARLKRRAWRLQWQRRSTKRKEEMSLLNMTPPQTPATSLPNTSDAASRGRKKVRRDRAKAYRLIIKLQDELHKERKRKHKYLKRWQRCKTSTTSSPRTNTRKLLRGSRVSCKVKKTLLFHNAIVEQIKQKYKKGDRSLVKKIATGNIIKKYRLQSYFSRAVGRARVKTQGKTKTSKKSCYIERIVNAVKVFLERDDNSRMAPGKKDCITRNKVKKQKRYLSYSLIHLHQKYKKETGSTLSYSLFCRLRPFWISKPKVTNRDTCKCIIHENMQLKADKLKQLKITEDSSIESLTKQICCDTNNRKCMYRICKRCCNKEIPTNEHNAQDSTYYWEWVQRKECYTSMKDGKPVEVSYKITSKDKKLTTVGELVKILNDSLKRICTHEFNMKHQFRTIRNLKKDLKEDEAVIHVDFSENFNCGYSSEVQAAHFGASHRQATLHTGVLYTNNQTEPFCTVSSSKRHDPSAIWAHLQPVLQDMRKSYPHVKTIHFISDGPTTQYRNRKNMYLFSSVMFDKGFRNGTWNFTESGHGKGAPDGVGGSLKRRADELIAQGQDVPDAMSLFNVLKQGTTVKLFYIYDESIHAMDEKLKPDIPAVQGIMKTHQVCADQSGKILTRTLSCFCHETFECDCFAPKLHDLDVKDSIAQSGDVTDQNSETEETGNVTDNNLDGNQEGSLSERFPTDRYCLFVYESKLYPGKIVSVDDDDGEIEISSLKPVGTNKYVWPQPEDKLWYDPGSVRGLIKEPTKQTKRLFKVDDQTWFKIQTWI